MALPTLSVLDNFNRAAEKPLSNGGKWALIGGEVTTGEIKATEENWRGETAFKAGSENAAYWTPVEFTNPAVAAKIAADINGLEGRGFRLYACLQSPTSATEKSGYILYLEETTTGAPGKYTFKLQKMTKSVVSALATVTAVAVSLGDLFALQVSGGKVIAWHKEGAGAWTIVAEGTDSTWTKGFVGMGMAGNIGRLDTLEAGEGVVLHEHTLTASQGKTPTMRHEAIARTLTRTQGQAAVAQRAIARSAFTATQGSAATQVGGITRSATPFTVTQGQSATRTSTPLRTLTVTQGTVKQTSPSSLSLGVLDNFNRANEKPLTGPWAVIGLAVKIGEIAGEKYTSSDTFGSGEDAAYYTTREFSNPVITVEVSTLEQSAAERYYSMYVCLQTPGVPELSGYRARLVETNTGNPVKYKFLIEKITKGVVSTLAEVAGLSYANPGGPPAFAFSSQGGLLTIWKLAGGVWEPVLEAHDATWASGFVGLGIKGTVGKLDTPSAASTNNATVIETNVRAHTFTAIQASSYGPQLPETPVTDFLEEPLGFNEGVTWTILSWSEIIGEGRELNKGLTLKPHPRGWGTSEAKKAGARYNVLQVRDPINFMAIRNVAAGATENTAALGICVPASGERSGYVARIEATATVYNVFLEKWVNGVKTVLAETTLAEGFFGAAATGKAAPFALTLVGGTLRLWLSAASGTPPTVLLSANDSTFTSGYNTMEVTGTSWLLSKIHVASMDGQIVLTGSPGKGQILEAAQGSSATRGATQIARMLSMGQASSPAIRRAITRTLAATQGQAVALVRAAARKLAATQGSTASKGTAISRNLTSTQSSGVSLRRDLSHTFSFGLTQVASLARTLAQQLTSAQGSGASIRAESARALSAAQAQSISRRATVSRGLTVTASSVATRAVSLARTLVAGQAQAPSQSAEASLSGLLETTQGASAHLSRSPSHALGVGQAQAISRQAAISRLLSATASAVARRTAALARTLRISQGQGAAQEGEAEHLTRLHTLEAGQGSGASLSRTATRRLTASAGANASIARAVSRTLRISGSSSPTVRRELPHGLATSCTQSASLGGTQVRRSLVATQPAVVVLARAVGRSLTSTQPQAIMLVNETIEVPLPPPVNMSSSTNGNASASTAAAKPPDSTLTGGASASSAVAKPPSSSVGGDVLTSSVEAR